MFRWSGLPTVAILFSSLPLLRFIDLASFCLNMKAATLLLPGAAVVCAYTVTTAERFMLKNIDPIVVPGQYISHMHSFFGSDAVTVNTTTSEELQEGCSTAENPNDYSIYCKSSPVTCRIV